MVQQTEVDWPTCELAGCIGVRLDSARMCLAHGSEEETAAALKLVSETGVIDARGVPITPALLEQVLTAAPRGENGGPLIKDCRFDWATFSGDAMFTWATFSGDAKFTGATFKRRARFEGTPFSGEASFFRATFSGDARFLRATFKRGAGFQWATFSSLAWFEGATFSGAGFYEATFSGEARFDEATFSGGARFDRATFMRRAGFDQVTFKHLASFAGARFELSRQFGPILAYRGLVLDNVQFAQPVQVEVSTPGVCCRRARFPGGV